MIITISGKAGSGKSTIAKILAKKLNYKHYSIGDLQRKLANELGLTIEKLGELEKTDKKYDHMMDQKTKDLGKNEDDFVIDSWLAPNFIPKAFKIFLDVDIDIAIKRRVKHHRDEEKFTSLKETKKSLLNRQKVNRDRWMQYYGYDFLDMKNYDLEIDTTNKTVEEIIKIIIDNIK